MNYTREKESPCKHCTRVISVKNINQHDQREWQARFEQCARIKTNRNKDNPIIILLKSTIPKMSSNFFTATMPVRASRTGIQSECNRDRTETWGRRRTLLESLNLPRSSGELLRNSTIGVMPLLLISRARARVCGRRGFTLVRAIKLLPLPLLRPPFTIMRPSLPRPRHYVILRRALPRVPDRSSRASASCAIS